MTPSNPEIFKVPPIFLNIFFKEICRIFNFTAKTLSAKVVNYFTSALDAQGRLDCLEQFTHFTQSLAIKIRWDTLKPSISFRLSLNLCLSTVQSAHHFNKGIPHAFFNFNCPFYFLFFILGYLVFVKGRTDAVRDFVNFLVVQ